MRFWIELRGPARLWTASITFTLLGTLFAFFLPRAVPDPVIAITISILGWTFFILGLLVLVPMLITLYIRRTSRERERVWHWWINFVGGMVGALVFAIPATFLLPISLIAYVMRPNALFPADETKHAENLWLAALFSVVGIATLIATIWLARIKLRKEDPREGV